MTRWLISVPVWGERYVDEFCATTLPALDRAIAALTATRDDIDVRLLIHTDQPDRVRGTSGSAVECRPVPAGARDFDCMSQAHREALASGMLGDVVVLLTAGAVISEQGLVYCADVLDNPRIKVVLCAVPRVLQEGQLPDTGDAAVLMAWAWEHRHPITQECTWPDGRSVDLSRTYYVANHARAVASRVCLPHPLAVRIDGRSPHFTPTVDANLVLCYDRLEMHMTPDCRELALIKLTPRDKGYDRVSATMAERLTAYELRIPDAFQRWFLDQRVTLVGPAGQDCGDAAVVEKIMRVSGGRS